FSSRRRHTRFSRDWSSDVCSSDLRGLFGFSDDGGSSWQVMQLDLDTPLSDFYQFNNILVATSAYGKLLVSRDEGDSWQLIETDRSEERRVGKELRSWGARVRQCKS